MSAPLPPEIRALLEAVHDALALPFPATMGDTGRYQEILARRASHAVIAIEMALRDEGDDWLADFLREQVAKNPPEGYAHWQGGGQS